MCQIPSPRWASYSVFSSGVAGTSGSVGSVGATGTSGSVGSTGTTGTSGSIGATGVSGVSGSVVAGVSSTGVSSTGVSSFLLSLLISQAAPPINAAAPRPINAHLPTLPQLIPLATSSVLSIILAASSALSAVCAITLAASSACSASAFDLPVHSLLISLSAERPPLSCTANFLLSKSASLSTVPIPKFWLICVALVITGLEASSAICKAFWASCQALWPFSRQ